MSKRSRPTSRRPIKLIGWRGKKKVRASFQKMIDEQDSHIKVVGVIAHARRGDMSRKDPSYGRVPHTMYFIVGESLANPHLALQIEPRHDSTRWAVTEVSPCCLSLYNEFKPGVTPKLRKQNRSECRRCFKHPKGSIFSNNWQQVFNVYFTLVKTKESSVFLEDAILPKFDHLMEDPFEAHLAAAAVGQSITALLLEFFGDYLADRLGFMGSFSTKAHSAAHPPTHSLVSNVAANNGLTVDPNSNGYVFKKVEQ